MIPLRDINPTRTRPTLTYTLIGANVLVFLYQVSLGPAVGQFAFRYGMVPRLWLSSPEFLYTPLTSMFMHGGWMHLISNMWFLHIFGDNIEDALGRARYIGFYVTCGLGAAMAQYAVDPSSAIPMVGASGAIAGVLGAYYKLYPRARIVALIPVFVVMVVRELPAVFFIVIWFLIQLFSGLGSLGSLGSGTGGVAFFAHIGGFVVGVSLLGLFRPGPGARRIARRGSRS